MSVQLYIVSLSAFMVSLNMQSSVLSVWRYVEKRLLRMCLLQSDLLDILHLQTLYQNRVVAIFSLVTMAAILNFKMADLYRGSQNQLTPIKLKSISSHLVSLIDH